MVWNEKMAFLPTSDYLFQHHHHHHVNEDHHHPSPPTHILTSSVPPPQDFQGINPSLSMINQHRSSPIMSLSGYDEHDHNYYSYGNEDMMGGMDGLGHHGHGHHPVGDDDMSDDGSQVLGEKKKRLNIEQVKTLEKNFELGNKLEPERKTQLAKALGLQPRQVAIWFQNRRARWKTKQLEKDFNLLRRRFESLQADNDSLQSQNKKLHAELQALKNNETPELLGTINLNAESKGYWSNNGSDISSDINLGISTTTTAPPTDSPLSSTNLGFASSFMPTSLTAGLLHAPSKQEHGGHHNYDQTTVQEDGFCNIFGPTGAGVAVSQELKTPAFWPWPEQQNLP